MPPEVDLLQQAFSILTNWRLITHGAVTNIRVVLLVESALASLQEALQED